jgi:hypothetical protein
MKDVGMVRHIVPILAAQNLAATTVCPNVAMKKFESVQFIVALGDLGTADFTLTVTASAVTAGSSATALTFKYRATAAAGTDTLGDLSSGVTSLVLTNTTYDNKTIVIDVDANELTADKPYVGITLTRGGSATAYIAITALLKPRYPQATNDGALT